MKKPYFGLLILCLMSPLAQAATDCAAVTEIPSTECEVLVTLYNSTDGANWKDHSGWLETNTPCSWDKVTCSAGHVSELKLYYNQLSGTIPPELSLLSHLTVLSLSRNELSGTIPPELSLLSHLTVLYLSRNELTGTIPPELSLLSNLTGLYLSRNELTGTIPAELAQLSNLTVLYLYSNQLSGTIPPELAQLSNLTELYLYDNQLSGTIPPELAQLSKLTILWLENNQLSGTIPPELGNLSNLKYLDLHSNQLSGTIPPELAQLSKLRTLYLSDNQLCGKIPSELMNLTNLKSSPYGIRLQNNNLINSDTTYPANFTAWLDEKNPVWRNQVSPSYCSLLHFSTTNYNVNEGEGTTTIPITHTGNNQGAISTNYTSTDGTATAGNDYTQTTGTLSWGDGDLVDKTITIAITDDGDSEGNETFTITLTDPISGESLDNATVTILDNDTTLVTLAEFTATALENANSVEWQTTTELDNAGFHLWRATGEGWKYGDYSTVIRLTEQLMPAQGDFSVYSYIDTWLETGLTYYYGLEDIDLNGQSTFHWDLIDSATAR